MFPIAKSVLSFGEISDYWSREISPPASSKELFQILEAAWWLGELLGDSVPSPLEMLKKMFTSMRHRAELGIVFVVGNSTGPHPIQSPDGSMTVDTRPQIRVPSSNTDTWDESSCRDAFQALAETCSLDSYPELAITTAWIPLSYDEFTRWREKCGYPAPTFWQPRSKKSEQQSEASRKKRWNPAPGKSLTPAEQAIMEALNTICPNGKLKYITAQTRNERINEEVVRQHQRAVAPRTINRALEKLVYA
jgi:hypothetical protein